MTKALKQSTIADPSLFISPAMMQDMAAINQRQYRWKDQPLWPQKKVSFSKPDRNNRRQLINALVAEGSSNELLSIGFRLLMCSRSKPCGSPLCNYCRTKLQDRYQARVLRYFGKTHRDDLFWLTILDDLTYDPLQDVQGRFRKLRVSFREFLKRNCHKDARVFGAFEIDVKRHDLIDDNDAAIQTLQQYGLRNEPEPAYMPHLHAIVSLDGITRDELDRQLTSLYARPSQVRLMSMRPGQTKIENLSNLARYMFKFRYQFADNILRDRSAYGKRFDDKTLRVFTQLVHSIKGDRGAIGLEFRYNL